MLNRNLMIVRRKLQATWYQFKPHMKAIGIRLAFVALVLVLITQKELSFQFSIGGNPAAASPNAPASSAPPDAIQTKGLENLQQTSIIPSGTTWWEDIRENQSNITDELNLANAATAVGEALTQEQQDRAAQFSNLGFILNPGYAQKHKIDPAIVEFKKQKCANYISTYLQTAQEEAELYNIPVSITLAQGLLESNVGDSRLAKNDNNHFGIKCKKKCIGCRCANYTDDSKYDMFRVFDTPWYSFREHSKLLTGKRYKHLLQLKRSDYRNWANGLQSAGYATDKSYAKKLIGIIEALNLHRYDV